MCINLDEKELSKILELRSSFEDFQSGFLDYRAKNKFYELKILILFYEKEVIFVLKKSNIDFRILEIELQEVKFINVSHKLITFSGNDKNIIIDTKKPNFSFEINLNLNKDSSSKIIYDKYDLLEIFEDFPVVDDSNNKFIYKKIDKSGISCTLNFFVNEQKLSIKLTDENIKNDILDINLENVKEIRASNEILTIYFKENKEITINFKPFIFLNATF